VTLRGMNGAESLSVTVGHVSVRWLEQSIVYCQNSLVSRLIKGMHSQARRECAGAFVPMAALAHVDCNRESCLEFKPCILCAALAQAWLDSSGLAQPAATKIESCNKRRSDLASQH